MWQKPLWNRNEILHEKPIFLKFSLENVKDIPWTCSIKCKFQNDFGSIGHILDFQAQANLAMPDT